MRGSANGNTIALVQAREVYGATEPRTGAIESTARLFEQGGFNHRPEIVSGVLADECAALIKADFAACR